jgi:hypothetical protein
MSFNVRKPVGLPLVAAIVVLGSLIVAQSAIAAFVRPNAATPMSTSMVVAYDQCSTGGVGSPPGEGHNPANLAGASCSPPTKSSLRVQSGDPTVFPGTVANFKANLKQVVAPGDVLFPSGGAQTAAGGPTSPSGGYAQDIRCGTSVACGNANTAGGADYIGLLSGNSSLRITDNNNGPAGGPYVDSGTVEQLLFTVPISCANSTSAAIGGYCVPATTSANALCSCVASGKRSNIEEGQVVMTDGGPDGNPFATGDGPNQDAARQGVFIP